MNTGVSFVDSTPLRTAVVDHVLGGGTLEQRLHQLVAEHAGGVEHHLAAQLGFDLQRRRDVALDDLLAVVALEAERAHLHQVDHALELVLEADRDLHHDRVVLELLAQLLGHAGRVGAGAVALVDEGDARHAVAPHLPVDGDRLALHAGHRAQHQDGAIEHLEGALHLDGEVDVPRGVDDVDLMVEPLGVRRRALDRDPALALQLHRVHGGADAVLALHLVNGPDAPGVEEDPFGQRGLARIDVGADADVPDPAQIRDHAVCPLRGGRPAAAPLVVRRTHGRPRSGRRRRSKKHVRTGRDAGQADVARGENSLQPPRNANPPSPVRLAPSPAGVAAPLPGPTSPCPRAVPSGST
jgi:hypothetical protein